MAKVDHDLNTDSLDALREIRRELFSIPESSLSAMSLDDQVAYGDTLHQVSLAILHLEAAKLKGVNDAFKARERELRDAASDLEHDLSELDTAVRVVRAASEGVKLVTNVVELLDGFA